MNPISDVGVDCASIAVIIGGFLYFLFPLFDPLINLALAAEARFQYPVQQKVAHQNRVLSQSLPVPPLQV
jgi:hypothetical protein